MIKLITAGMRVCRMPAQKYKKNYIASVGWSHALAYARCEHTRRNMVNI